MEKKEPTRITKIEISDLPQTEREGVDDSKELLGEQYLARLTEEERKKALLQAAATRKWIEENYPPAKKEDVEKRKASKDSREWLFQGDSKAYLHISANTDPNIFRKTIIEMHNYLIENNIDLAESFINNEKISREKITLLCNYLEIQDNTKDVPVYLKQFDDGNIGSFVSASDRYLKESDLYIELLEKEQRVSSRESQTIILHELIHSNSEVSLAVNELGFKEVFSGFGYAKRLKSFMWEPSLESLQSLILFFEKIQKGYEDYFNDLRGKELGSYIERFIPLFQETGIAKDDMDLYLHVMCGTARYSSTMNEDFISVLIQNQERFEDLYREYEIKDNLSEEDISKKKKIRFNQMTIQEFQSFNEAVVEFLAQIGMTLQQDAKGEIYAYLENFQFANNKYKGDVKKIFNIVKTLEEEGENIDQFVKILGQAEKHSDPKQFIDYMHENFSTVITDEDGNPKHIGVKIEFEKLLRAEIDYIPEQIKEYYRYQKAATL